MAHILIVDDERSIRKVLSMHLSLVGYQCSEAEDAMHARALLHIHKPDLVLVDIMMPGEDGFSLAETLIKQEIPVVFLTAKTDVVDRVKGLKMGAWDYIAKPFEPPELLARIENILNRTHKEETVFHCSGFFIDFPARKVRMNGKEIILTATEFDVLAALVRRRNVAVSRSELLNRVWGYDYIGETRTVDVHVQRLREKLGSHFIETVYKIGYRFQTNSPESEKSV